jgi:predicted Zn-dependent peptidase
MDGIFFGKFTFIFDKFHIISHAFRIILCFVLKPLILKNGLTVIRIPKNSSPQCLVGFVATTGSSNERGNFPGGISHFVEQLFKYGTDKHPSPRSLITSLEAMGGSLYTHTDQESSEFYLTVPSYNQYKAVSILSEIIQHSYFDPQDIERVRQNMFDKIKSFETHNHEIASDLVLENLYIHHPLGDSIFGSIESLMSIDRNAITNYLFHQYHPSRCYLVVAGDFDNKALVDLIDQEWGYWNPKNRPFQEADPIDKNMLGELPRAHYRQRGYPQTDIAIAFALDEGLRPQKTQKNESNEVGQITDSIEITEEEIATIKDEKLELLAKLLVLNTILGQGYTSRLWTKGVEDELFFSAIQSDLILFKKTGFIQILGSTDNNQFTFALEAIFSCIDSLKRTTASINELAKAKGYLKGRLLEQSESLIISTKWQIEHMIGSSLIYELSDLIEKINKIEANSVRALALDIFIPENLVITSLGTAKETRLVEKLIKKYIASL